ncbi:hypothetical protein QR680_012724 [Steinernema hermaphroditum]|uniref:Uncharacterized protein n=1 Tax=Steinernema hermaphroditum TaxID=289476 RepID=A0AA39I500_9BILA|nr:hypothetical protein QR680_012724 [Steinernema hermaphroditum]
MKFLVLLLSLALFCGIASGDFKTKTLGGVLDAPKGSRGFVEGHLPHGGVTLRPMKKIRRPVGERREERIKRQDYYYYYYYY